MRTSIFFIVAGGQKEFRFSSMSNARLRVNVVNRTFLPSGVRFSASHFARCIASTVLPVPAPPSTRTGPLRSPVASCALSRMEEHAPLRERRIHDGGQFVLAIDDDEPRL